MNKENTEELKTLLAQLAVELTQARFELGELPSQSDALRQATEYLKENDYPEKIYSRIKPYRTYCNTPSLLTPQAI